MYDHIVKTLIDEVEGLKGYYKMRAVAMERGDDVLTFWLQQIIKDERSHVKWIWEYLKEHGADTREVDHMCREVLE
jgi:ferritin